VEAPSRENQIPNDRAPSPGGSTVCTEQDLTVSRSYASRATGAPRRLWYVWVGM